MRKLTTIRHDAIFDHTCFLTPLHIVGVGGVGSYAAEQLGKLGCGRMNELHLWDGDRVEAHNLSNQALDPKFIGFKKTHAVHARLVSFGATQVHLHDYFIEGPVALSGVVFVCVDSMKTRKLLWDVNLKQNLDVELMIEIRMDALNFVVHTLNPNNASHAAQWEELWYPDEEGTNVIAGCGSQPQAVGPTGSTAANVAVWQLIRHVAIKLGEKDRLPNRIQGKLRPIKIEEFHW